MNVTYVSSVVKSKPPNSTFIAVTTFVFVLMTALAVAPLLIKVPLEGSLITTVGTLVYPEPPLVTAIPVTMPLDIVAVAAALVPPPPEIITAGVVAYPDIIFVYLPVVPSIIC